MFFGNINNTGFGANTASLFVFFFKGPPCFVFLSYSSVPVAVTVTITVTVTVIVATPTQLQHKLFYFSYSIGQVGPSKGVPSDGFGPRSLTFWCQPTFLRYFVPPGCI